MVQASTSTLANYLDLYAQKLRVDLQAARLFIGTTDIGNVAESAVRTFLQSNLPARYSVGVGEAIAPDGKLPQRLEQTQQKDVLIYDAHGCTVFGWDQGEVSLFPVESIYGVIEVKTNIDSTAHLLNAVKQALEVKELCQRYRDPGQAPPFTGVFAFETGVNGKMLFNALRKKSAKERADFVFILNPKPGDVSQPDSSFYFVHWHYYSRGGGPIDFVSADQAAQERSDNQDPDKRLTFCESEKALLWFYLFLARQLDSMQLKRPDLWKYANASKERLGWRDNE